MSALVKVGALVGKALIASIIFCSEFPGKLTKSSVALNGCFPSSGILVLPSPSLNHCDKDFLIP
jgi:hypothetical protein